MPTATVKPTSVTAQDAVWNATATASNLADVDSAGATWTKSTTASQTGAFTLAGYPPAATIPAGSVLKSATLRVVYKNTAGVTGDARTVVLTPAAGGSPISSTLPATSGAATKTALVDLYGGGTSALAAAVHSFGFTGAGMTYSAKLAHTGTETVDAVQLDLSYIPPALRGQTTTAVAGNCLASTYPSGCAMLSTPTSYHDAVYIQGTTYVPLAVIDLSLSNAASQVMRFGLIARALYIKETGSFGYTGPVIEVPDNSPGFGPGGTLVYLDVYLCLQAATCSTSTGVLSLRARVLIYDPSAVPSPPARQITIQSWSVQR